MKNFKKEIFAPVDQKKFNINNSFKIPNYINTKKTTITTVASLVPVKGIEYFIDAADKLYAKNKNLDFIIAGPEINSQTKYSQIIKKKISGKDYIKYIDFTWHWLENNLKIDQFSDLRNFINDLIPHNKRKYDN